MPELPEVETTRLGVMPHTVGRVVKGVIIRNGSLRWPVSAELEGCLSQQSIISVARRAKYLLFSLSTGTLMIHLGMSGSLRIVPCREPPKKHDHIDVVFDSGYAMRYHDPRRFGSFHWLEPGEKNPLLESLGVEPLSDAFDGAHLYKISRGRNISVKQFIMDGRVVVGVGNIYASEALFLSGIRPDRASGRISCERYDRLTRSIKFVLESAIKQGGTTLRNFVGASGAPGYFSLELNVYGREGESCNRCGKLIFSKVLGQRSSFYCSNCQR